MSTWSAPFRGELDSQSVTGFKLDLLDERLALSSHELASHLFLVATVLGPTMKAVTCYCIRLYMITSTVTSMTLKLQQALTQWRWLTATTRPTAMTAARHHRQNGKQTFVVQYCTWHHNRSNIPAVTWSVPGCRGMWRYAMVSCQCPPLSTKYCMQYLSIPATSVQSEWQLSAVGLLISKLHSRLYHVNTIIFLCKNM